MTTEHDKAVALADKLLEVFQGWQTATFGWQDDPDYAVAAKNYDAAAKAHRDECIRRVLAVLAERDKQHTEELAQRPGVMPLVFPHFHGVLACDPFKVREAIASLEARNQQLEAKMQDAEREVDSLKDQLDEQNTWPNWANQILKMVRERSGNDGHDDMSEGVDLPDEVDEALSELAAQAERANAKLEQAEREAQSLNSANTEMIEIELRLSAKLEQSEARVRELEERALFMYSRGYYIGWNREGDACRVFGRADEESGFEPVLGWKSWFNTAEEAINAAMNKESGK